ncbi:MAG: hypothetical protein CBC35_02135 [Planctomycetes bacterium TMED75]|nr:hypothetical protein [Planctomycetaceae bacterium]OUU95965.1 MAG: hypothetical protein CBC35_02135 [Planctomycetes bacterium TMED75]
MSKSVSEVYEDLSELISERRKEFFSGLLVILLCGAVAFFMWWWYVVRWQAPPSIFNSPVQNVLGYLAMDDFSQLPLEERVRFLMEFSDRFRDMEQSESATMAAFLAGISGPVRETATNNVRVLAKDILMDGASDYVNLPFSERADFLDAWVVRWTKVGERMALGEERETSDEDRVSDMKSQAERDSTRELDESRIPDLTAVSAVRFMDFWSSDVESTASPREQGQIVVFMTDLRKHLISD